MATYDTSSPTYKDRVRGCLLGGAIGDALGNPIEFLYTIKTIKAAYGPNGLDRMVSNLITDDTQMTLFTCEGLIRARHGDDPIAEVHDSYLRWLDTQGYTRIPPATQGHQTGWLREQSFLYARRAPGATCISGLDAGDPDDFSNDFEIGDIGPINSTSKGCGTVMRSAPFGLAWESHEAFELAADCSYLTHGHPTAAMSAGALALIVDGLVKGESLERATGFALTYLIGFPSTHETFNALLKAVRLAKEGNPTPAKVESLGGGWIAEEALAIAVYCALVESDPRKALLLAVNHGGDSDSTGAICGNLIGAWRGESALPADWAAEVEGREVILRVADDLVSTTETDLEERYPAS